MGKIYTLLSVGILFLSVNSKLYSQCNSAPCQTPIPAVNAQDACVLPNPAALDCYNGATGLETPVSFPPSWCSTVENNHFFAFTADANSTTFDICTYDCEQNDGIQAAVLSTSNCIDFLFVSPCLTILPGDCISLTAIGLVPGAVYYLMIDGNSGDRCDYSINGVDPLIDGPTSGICLPSSALSTYTTNTLSTWTINPPTAGSIQGNPNSSTVNIMWLEPGPAEVCVESIVCPNSPGICLPVLISEDIETFEMVDVCQGQTVECAGRVFSTGGTFPVTLQTYLGCDSVVNCVVHLIPTVITFEIAPICNSGSVICAGEEFFIPGTYPVSLISDQGCDSIVNCVVKIVPTYNGPTMFVNLCAPAQYEVCNDFYTQTGVYEHHCLGYLGCDSIVNLDLAILNPVAVIAPPEQLPCDSTQTLVLNGAMSSINTATAGLTSYSWFGPGIVGPNDQATVEISKPGEYCLILQHSRGNLACSDTSCVIVQQTAGVPQITGIQTPCVGTAYTYSVVVTGDSIPSSFVWSLPPGQGFTEIPPNSIQLDWLSGDSSRQICVLATNVCGSVSTCLPIIVHALPLTPVVSGPNLVCAANGNYLFHLDSMQTGTNYQWTVPSGAVLTGSGDSVLVNFDQAVSGSVCVVAQNSCGPLTPVCQDVIVVPNPSGALFATPEICAGASLNLLFNLSGNGPFDVVWSDGIQNFNLNDISNGHQISVSPLSNTVYRLLSIADNSTIACSSAATDSVMVSVWPGYYQSQTILTCANQPVFLAGSLQTQAGVYFDSLITVHGCDSIMVSTLVVMDLDTTWIVQSTCDPNLAGTVVQTLTQINGCDSVLVTTTNLLPSDLTTIHLSTCIPANAGVFTQNLLNQFGCDSTVVTTVVFSNADTTHVSGSTCDPSEVGVFSQLLMGMDGCDSLIISTVSLLPSQVTTLDLQTCNPAQQGVFTQILSNQFGCDSTVITTITFNGIPPTLLSATTCDPNAVGVFSNTITTMAGCDSTIVTTITLLPVSNTTLFEQSCNPAAVGVFSQVLSNIFGCDSTVTTTVTFNGIPPTMLTAETCDSANAGIFTQTLITAAGCDSLVITAVELMPSHLTQLFEQDCDPANVGVFTQDLSNQFGCDSTVVLTVSLLPSHTTAIQSSTCDPAVAGVFTYPLVNQFGCDSIVTETVLLLPSNSTTLTQGTCDPAEVGVTQWVLSNQFGCDSIINTVTSLLPANLCSISANVSGSFIPCGMTTGSLTLSLSLGMGPFSFEVWLNNTPISSGNINAVNEPLQLSNLGPGDYTVNFSSANGFAISEQASIVAQTPATLTITPGSNFGGFGVSCAGASDGIISVTANGGFPPFNFAWSNGASTAQLEDLAAEMYIVTVTDASNCISTASGSITAPASLEITFSVAHPNCFGNQNGAIVVNATGGIPPYRFMLNGGLLQSENVFSNLGAGAYTVKAIDANNCENTEIILINAPLPLTVDLGDDLTLNLGQMLSLQAIVNVPFDSLASVIWSPLPDSSECDQCLNQTFVPLISTTYSIQIVDQQGCRDEDEIKVLVNRQKHIYVPNVFSPNDDGWNDKLSIFVRPNSVKMVRSFAIYDRWGEQVYKAEHFLPLDNKTGWDGQFRAQALNPGVFVWVLEVEFIDGAVEQYQGDVTLVR